MHGAAAESLRVCIYCRVALALVPEVGRLCRNVCFSGGVQGCRGRRGQAFPPSPECGSLVRSRLSCLCNLPPTI